MKISIRMLAAPMSLAFLIRPVWAAAVEPPAPVLEWSFYVLLIFAICVAAFVFFRTSNKRKRAPLSIMLGESRRPINSVPPSPNPFAGCIARISVHCSSWKMTSSLAFSPSATH